MKIKVETQGGKFIQRTVHRKQYPITAAYAFTDYRSQGQTLPYVLIDVTSLKSLRLPFTKLGTKYHMTSS